MRSTGIAILFLMVTASQRVEAAGQPYGCWAIRDDVERLACFDMALGPPAGEDPVGPGSESAPATSKAGPPAGKATPD